MEVLDWHFTWDSRSSNGFCLLWSMSWRCWIGTLSVIVYAFWWFLLAPGDEVEVLDSHFTCEFTCVLMVSACFW